MNRAQQMTLLGSLGLVVGAILPWSSLTSRLYGSLSSAGYEGDGLITGGIGLAMAVTAFLRKGMPGRRYSVVLGLGALLAGGISLSAWARLSVAISGMNSSMAASIGPGVYLTMVAAVLAAVGAFQKLAPLPAPPAATLSPAPEAPQQPPSTQDPPSEP